MLAEGNPGRQFTYFGELRGEGITEETARLLREANFTEVEVGLQSIEPDAQTQMDRKNNLRAFERGVRAMLDQGIRVKVDLIVGLPGDTVESVRRGLHYLRDDGLYSDVQVFNLSVLPGTAFRAGGAAARPEVPAAAALLRPANADAGAATDLYGLMHEAQDLFAIEFDAQPPPMLEVGTLGSSPCVERVNLDFSEPARLGGSDHWRQAFTLWLRSANFDQHCEAAARCIRQVLEANPFTTLQVVLEPFSPSFPASLERDLSQPLFETLASTAKPAPLTWIVTMHCNPAGRMGLSAWLP